MMKNMILPIAFTALIASMTACSDETDPILTQKDWDGTATYFQSSDEHGFSMYYKPQVGFVGDPMPFYDPVAKDFKVMYLQDYRPNPEATYHPIFGVATKDGATYESLGELIPCGGRDEQDAAIGTGGTIYNPVDKLYYTFYTGNKFKPSSDQNAQVVMVATSPDFKTWTKNRTFYLKGDTYGYDKNDFRDPFLFQTEDGVYHMLIATRKNGKGHIAEFTSTDLKEWASAGTFMTMMWDRFYECPDVFKMGDWWYLVYSEQASFMRKVQYFKGKTLEELKATTANDAGIWPDNREGMLDSRAFYAGKTASDGTNRYIWGWCPTRAGNDNGNVGDVEPEWAGNLVAQRLIQHEDGTLTLGVPDAIDRKYTSAQEVKVMAKDGNVTESGKTYMLAEGASVIFNRLKVHNKISFTVKASSNTDRFGISFVRGTDSKSWYSIHVNADEGKANFEKDGDNAKYLFDNKFNIPSDNEYRVTIYSDQSVCVTYINDQLSFTNRIYQMQKNPWSLCCYKGEITVSDIQVSTY